MKELLTEVSGSKQIVLWKKQNLNSRLNLCASRVSCQIEIA
jgi:hypothetical protein